jgi:hypothetical protein
VLLAMLTVVFAILLWTRVVVLIYMESRWPVLD